MSRTEGVHLPRLPRLHTRVTSPGAIRPHQATRERHVESKAHRRTLSEPSYTAYIGTPRQDVPWEVYRDAAMFDEVFDKKGALLLSRKTPKIISPLNSLHYSSLHDPHCQKLFMNNKRLRTHLVNMGLITCDLKVVASTLEQRQKIRAHELLERREGLIQKLEHQEQQRLERLQHQMKLPQLYRENILKDERRRIRAEEVQQVKLERVLLSEAEKKRRELRTKEERRRKLKEAVEMARLREQARRNSARTQQELAEMMAYEKQYGRFGRQLALWHRDSDEIHNKMIMMERKYWARMRHQRHQQLLAEKVEPESRCSSGSSGSVDVERVHDLLPLHIKPSESSSPSQPQVSSESQPQPQTGVDMVTEGAETLMLAEEEKKAKETIEHREDGSQILDISNPQNEEEDKEDGKEEEEQPSEAVESSKDDDARQDGDKAEVSGISQPQDESVVVLYRDESSTELTKILLAAFSRVRDIDANLGYIHMDEFIQLLNSRDLGLQLNEDELLYIAEQTDVNLNGWIPLVQILPQLPPLLLAIYNQRAEQAVQHYGSYLEEQWCQIYLPDGGVAYFNKLTGILQYGGRPDDFRPNLKDEAFEESIVDFFETADSNKDGVVDYNDFYTLLISPMVSTRVYSNQIEELLQIFESYSIEGLMTLEQFGAVAKMLLMMIYQNAYPDVEDWIELQTTKYGTVLFNKQTGEISLPASQGEATPVADGVRTPDHSGAKQPEAGSSQKGGTPQPALRKRKKHGRRVSWSDENTPTSNTTPINTTQEATSRPVSQAAPPPLRRRRSRSQETSAPTTAESACSSSVSKEESSSIHDETKMEHKSVVEESIPSKEDSSPIPEAVNTTGVPEQNPATDGTGYDLPDDDQVTKSSEPTPDPKSSIPDETAEARESIPILKNPIPTKLNDKSEDVTKSDEKTPTELNIGGELTQPVHESDLC